MSIFGVLLLLTFLAMTYGYLRNSEDLISRQNDTLWDRVEGRMRKLIGSNCLLVERGVLNHIVD
jgi:hypothetical protein